MRRTKIITVSIAAAVIIALSAYAYWQQRFPWGKFATVRGMEQTGYQFFEYHNQASESWQFLTERPAHEVATSLIAEAHRLGAPENELVITEEDEFGSILQGAFKSGATYWSISVQNEQSPGSWRTMEHKYPDGATIRISRSNEKPEWETNDETDSADADD